MLEQQDNKVESCATTNGDKGAESNKNCEGVRADKGLGHYPITDLQFDVVTLVFEKSKALQAYDKYIRDSQPNEELRALFEKIAHEDKQHVEELKNFLGKC